MKKNIQKDSDELLKARKEKARWRRILTTYGLSKDQYEELDSGSCPICLREWNETVKPVIDHDHKTGEIRGILCRYCNHRIVGRHRDADILKRVVLYLEKDRIGVIAPKKRKKKSGKLKSKSS